MKLKFTYKGSDFFTDNLSFIPQINSSVKIYDEEFKVINTIIDYDFEENNQLVKHIVCLEKANETKTLSNNKKARCVDVWNQSIDNLTIGKEYDIVFEEEKRFFIITDKGVRRHYKWNNTQFVIIN